MEALPECEAAGDKAADEQQDPTSACKPTEKLALPAQAVQQLTPVPDDASSRGSALHAAGECQPCAWFWRTEGCRNGADCGRCHLCPEGEIKARKKKKHAVMKLGLATPKAGSGLRAQEFEAGQPWKVSFDSMNALTESPTQRQSEASGMFGPSSLPMKLPLQPANAEQEVAATSFWMPMTLPLQSATGAAAWADGWNHESAGVWPTGLSFSCNEVMQRTPKKAHAKPLEERGSPETTAYGSDKEDMHSLGSAGGSGSEEDGSPVRPPPGLQAPPVTPSVGGSSLHHLGFWMGGPESQQDFLSSHFSPEEELEYSKCTKQAMMRLGLATPKTLQPEEAAADFQM